MDQEKAKRFGLFIARQRVALGMSQGALAESLGIARAYLSQIENGWRMPSEELTGNIMARLGLPMTDFMVEVMGPELTDAQKEAATRLLMPIQWLSERLSPDELVEFMNLQQSIEEMAVNLGTLTSEPIQVGPEGWTELGKEDRRLVQRIINRLRTK